MDEILAYCSEVHVLSNKNILQRNPPRYTKQRSNEIYEVTTNPESRYEVLAPISIFIFYILKVMAPVSPHY